MSEAGGTGRAQLVAVAAAAFLVLFKGGAAWLTSSLALGAAALDSAVDVVVSSASYFVVRRSAAPPDADHPFGHGRFESLAALGQGLLLLGVAVLAAAMTTSWLVSWHLGRAAARSGSPALRADSMHYRADLWVNAGAVIALLLVRWRSEEHTS